VAAEEAKIEMTAHNASSLLLRGLDVDGQVVDVDRIVTDRTTRLRSALIDRSIGICTRLLGANGLGDGALERVVLVRGQR